MSHNAPNRERELDGYSLGRLDSGPNMVDTERYPHRSIGDWYLGDNAIRINDSVNRPITIQLHQLNVIDAKGQTLIPKCIVPRIWTPSEPGAMRIFGQPGRLDTRENT